MSDVGSEKHSPIARDMIWRRTKILDARVVGGILHCHDAECA
jgi:hypothetical protein